MPELSPAVFSLLRSLNLDPALPPEGAGWAALLSALSAGQLSGAGSHHTPLLTIDATGHITAWEKAAQNLFGYGPEMVGQPVGPLLASTLEQQHLLLMFREALSGGRTLRDRLQFVGADGPPLPVCCHLHPAPHPHDDQTLLHISAELHRPALGHQLTGRRFYESLLDTLPAPVAIFDDQHRYIYCNPAAIRNDEIREWIIGKTDAEYVAYRGFDPEIARRRGQYYLQAVEEHRTVYFEEEIVTPQGEAVHQLRTYTPFFSPNGSLLMGIGHGMDITALKRTQAELTTLNNELEGRVSSRTAELEAMSLELQHAAFHDTLTGLPNRTFFIERLQEAIQRRAANPQQLYAVLFLDTDRFKGVNDTLGHPTGDALLCELADRIKRVLRSSDVVSRFGGDEFAVLLEPLDHPERATQVAQRIQTELRRPMLLDGYEVSISASIGVVLGDTSYDTAMAPLRDADIAMYRAKAAGRARSQVFTPEMRRETIEMNLLENDLRAALGRDELRVMYQSIVRLEDLRVTGVEALVRWQHPERGLLMPGEFLHVAEESGLLLEIDRWILRHACQQMQQWRDTHPDAPPLELSVNFSGQQFTAPGVTEWIRETLDETGFDPCLLNLEITEGVLLATPEAIGHTLEEVRGMGIRLHLDDFGTGYSALSYLHQYSLSTLKIDRSFVGGMLEQKGSAELVRTIVAMAQNMGMCVVAEGVETPEQLAALSALGCEYGQGYLFSKPFDLSASPEVLEELLGPLDGQAKSKSR